MYTNKNDHVSFFTANRVDHGPMVNKQANIVYVSMYDQDFKQCVGVVSLAIHARGYKRFMPGGRDSLCMLGLHDIEGVRCTLASFSSVMYGIVFGVTPPDALRKMNQDNVIVIHYLIYDYEHEQTRSSSRTASEVMFRTLQRIKQREREKKDTKQLYRFLPQTGSSPIPLALPRRVH